MSKLRQTKFPENPPPVEGSGASKIVGFFDCHKATRISIESLHKLADPADLDVPQRPLVGIGGTSTTPSGHLFVMVFQCEDKVSSLDTPAPPLCPLSASTTERVEITDHFLPDFTEVLEETSGNASRSKEDTHLVHNAIMWAPGYS